MHVELHLRTIREACGLNLGDVCDVIEYSKGHLSKLERGERVLTVPILPRLARLYQCHPFDFLTFHHFPQPRILRAWRCPTCGSPTDEEH